MALKYLQGFDHWGEGTSYDTNMLSRMGLETLIAASVVNVATGAAFARLAEGKGMKLTGLNSFTTTGFGKRVPEDLTSMITGYARALCSNSGLSTGKYISTYNGLLDFWHIDSFGTKYRHCTIGANKDGHIYVLPYSQSGNANPTSTYLTIIATDGLFNDSGLFNFIEAGLDLTTPSTPKLTIWLNGRIILNEYTHANLKNPSINYVNTVGMLFPAGSSDAYTAIDDWYMLDKTGTDCNDFLGPLKVRTLFPSAAGSTTELTPVGASSNWQAVLKAAIDMAPTVYNNAPTFPLKDMYNIDDTPSDLGALLGVMIEGGFHSTALVSNGKMRAKLSASEVLQDLIVNYDTVQLKQFPLSADPSGASWTKAALDALEVGYSRED